MIVRQVISRLMKNAFMAGYEAALNEAALNNATGEMDGSLSWPYFEPNHSDWERLEKHLSETGN